MKRLVIGVVAFALFLANGAAGILAAAGLCALIWGSSNLDTALGSPPERTHPAFITFMCVAVILMVVGLVAGFVIFLLPATIVAKDKQSIDMLRKLCLWFLAKTDKKV